MKKLMVILLGLSMHPAAFAGSPAKVSCDFGKDVGPVTFLIDLAKHQVDTVPRTNEDFDFIHIASKTWKIVGADRESIPDIKRYDENDFKDMTLTLKGSDADDTGYRVTLFFGIQRNPKVRAVFTVHPFSDSRKMSTYSAQDCVVL